MPKHYVFPNPNPVKEFDWTPPKAIKAWKIKLKNKKLQKLMDYVQQLSGSTKTDCKLMFDEIRKKNYKRVLELGVSYGQSTIPLLIAVYLNKGKLVSNDIKKQYLIDNWLDRFNCEFLKKRWQFILADDMTLNFDKKFDMIFLDTSHVHYHTVRELEKFSKLSDVIYCHDYNTNGVRLPISDFIKDSGWQIKIYRTDCKLARLSN